MLRDVFLVFLYYLNELEVSFFTQIFTGNSFIPHVYQTILSARNASRLGLLPSGGKAGKGLYFPRE